MSRCFDGTGLGPAEQLMRGYEALPHFQVFFAVVGDLFCQLLGMRQKEVDVRSARAAVSTAAVASRAARFWLLAPPRSRLPRRKDSFVVRVTWPMHSLHWNRFTCASARCAPACECL